MPGPFLSKINSAYVELIPAATRNRISRYLDTLKKMSLLASHQRPHRLDLAECQTADSRTSLLPTCCPPDTKQVTRNKIHRSTSQWQAST